MVGVMTQQETAARDLEAAAAELETFIRECPDAVWTKALRGDGRRVGSIAYHCAAGNDVALGWICQVLAGRPVLETADSHNAHIIRGPQPETVRDYTVEVEKPDGQRVEVARVTGNHQRLRRHAFEPVAAAAVRIRITATNGAEQARIYEVRCYA